MASIDYFKDQTAWFSGSVPTSRKDLWTKHGGELANEDEALFLFSDKADVEDTRRLYASEAYLHDHLAVFHGSFVNECVRKKGMDKVVPGRYFLPPSEVHEIIREQTRFPWDVENTIAPEVSTHSYPRTPSSSRKSDNHTSRQSSSKKRTPSNKQHSQRNQNQTNHRESKQRKQQESEGHRNTIPQSVGPVELTPTVRLKRIAPESVESARLSSLLVSHDEPNLTSEISREHGTRKTRSTVTKTVHSQATPSTRTHQQTMTRSLEKGPSRNLGKTSRQKAHENNHQHDSVKKKKAGTSRQEQQIWQKFNLADARDIEDLPYVKLEDITDFTPGQNGCEVLMVNS